MHGGEHLAGDRRRADALVPEPVPLVELPLDRFDPSRLFRMPTRVVR
jgi:hypothetical protein